MLTLIIFILVILLPLIIGYFSGKYQWASLGTAFLIAILLEIGFWGNFLPGIHGGPIEFFTISYVVLEFIAGYILGFVVRRIANKS